MPCSICNSYSHNIVTCCDSSISINNTELFELARICRSANTHPDGELPSAFYQMLNFVRNLSTKMILKLYKRYAIHVYVPDPQHSFRDLDDWFDRHSQNTLLLFDPNSLSYTSNYARVHLDILIIQAYYNIADAVILGFRYGLIRERRPHQYFRFDINLVIKHSSTDNFHCLNDECGICWDKLHDETILSPHCGHAFCAGCMERSLDTVLQKAYNENIQPSFHCPLCRAQVKTLFHTNLLDELLLVPLINVIHNDLY